MSAGYAPMAAILATELVGRAFWGEPSDDVQFGAGHTFAGNPVGAAAALAVIRYMREHDLLARAIVAGDRLAERMHRLASSNDLVTDVRGVGLLRGLQFADVAPGSSLGTLAQQAARRRGLLARGDPDMLVLGPPLTSSDAEIDEIADVVDASVIEVTM